MKKVILFLITVTTINSNLIGEHEGDGTSRDAYKYTIYKDYPQNKLKHGVSNYPYCCRAQVRAFQQHGTEILMDFFNTYIRTKWKYPDKRTPYKKTMDLVTCFKEKNHCSKLIFIKEKSEDIMLPLSFALDLGSQWKAVKTNAEANIPNTPENNLVNGKPPADGACAAGTDGDFWPWIWKRGGGIKLTFEKYLKYVDGQLKKATKTPFFLTALKFCQHNCSALLAEEGQIRKCMKNCTYLGDENCKSPSGPPILDWCRADKAKMRGIDQINATFDKVEKETLKNKERKILRDTNNTITTIKILGTKSAKWFTRANYMNYLENKAKTGTGEHSPMEYCKDMCDKHSDQKSRCLEYCPKYFVN